MNRVKKIIAETFGVREDTLLADTNMKDIDSWDSLTHMELIANMESELGIEFTADEIMEMADVGKIIDIVGVKLNGN